jgi:hypothetical protein
MLRYFVMVVMMSLSALGAVRFLHDNPDVVDTAATVVRDTWNRARPARPRPAPRSRPASFPAPSGCAPTAPAIMSPSSISIRAA